MKYKRKQKKEPKKAKEQIKLICGNNLKILPTLKSNSVHSIVTDPPYELGFMNKSWDDSGIAYNVDMWKECLRVLKPGGHLLSFGGSRTYHRMACAIEDAGFEIRDQIMWIYGSGFPKSHNIGKAVDKLQGSERQNIGIRVRGDVQKAKEKNAGYLADPANRNNIKQFGYGIETITKGISEWEGWGTALKPAHEPIVLARKPIKGTIAQNVLKHECGALNIDECRIKLEENSRLKKGGSYSGNRTGSNVKSGFNVGNGKIEYTEPPGRWPANIIHDGSEEVTKYFPNSKGQQGDLKNHNKKENHPMVVLEK